MPVAAEETLHRRRVEKLGEIGAGRAAAGAKIGMVQQQPSDFSEEFGVGAGLPGEPRRQRLGQEEVVEAVGGSSGEAGPQQ